MSTPKDRFEACIKGREVDRPLRDLGGLAWSIADRKPYGYRSLVKFLGFSDIRVNLRPGSIIVHPVDEKVLRKLEVDFRHVRLNESIKWVGREEYVDSFGVLWRLNPSDTMYYPVKSPLANAKSVREVEEYDGYPSIDTYVNQFNKLRREAKYLAEETNYIVVCDLGAARAIFHRYAQMRGFSQWLLDFNLNQELYQALTNKIYECVVDIAKALLNEVGDYLDVVCVSDDMGSQNSSFFSREDYRRFVKPWFKRFLSEIRKVNSKVKILYHCCGSVINLISDFIDCGVDILNPIQPRAKNMDAEILSKRFKGKLCFHGGVDVQVLLPKAKPEEVKAEVKRIFKLLGPSYIVAPSHHIQGDIPPENIVAMYTAL